MALADTYEDASFGGVEFPVTDLSIKGVLDHHVHKYLHRPGGEVESLARHLYEFKFTCDFHNRYRRRTDVIERLVSLVRLCELGETQDLVVPSAGTYRAKAIDWTRNVTSTVRSGGRVNFTFIEDSTAEFTAATIIATGQSNSLPQMAVLFKQQTDQLGRPDLGTRVASAVNKFTAARNALDATAGGTAVSPNGVISTCKDVSKDRFFQDPRNAKAALVLQELWATAIDVSKSNPLSSSPANKLTAVTPTNVMELAMQLYGRSDKAAALLAVNNFTDALRIPAGSVINYVV